MITRWGFKRYSPFSYELVLYDSRGFHEVELYLTGYTSSKLRDILDACWYLNGSFTGSLPERKLQLFDMFRDDAGAYLKKIGFFPDPQSSV